MLWWIWSVMREKTTMLNSIQELVLSFNEKACKVNFRRMEMKAVRNTIGDTRPLHLYTVYHYTGQQALISEHIGPFLFIRYSFWYVFDKIHSKNARNLCLLRWTVLKTSVLTCNLRIPLFCAGARLSQHARIQEISCWEDIEEAILVGICQIKQCFYCN